MATLQEWHQELTARRAAAWAIVERNGCAALLVYGADRHYEPFRYLTNFEPVLGAAWAVLSGPNQASFVLNFDWQLPEARRRSGCDDWHGRFAANPVVVELLAATGARRVAVAGLEWLPVTAHAALRSRMPELELVDVGAEVARLRRHKSPLELAALREAARITDVALAEAREVLRPGVSEFEAAARLNYVIQSNGGDLSFPTGVISGCDQPTTMREPSDRLLQPGDTVMVDLGASFNGYQADATRSFVLGKARSAQQRAWDTVRRAHAAAFALAKPGVPCADLHRAACAIIEGAGYRVAHRTGHGIGLATSFEWPSIDTDTEPLAPGMTICIEPAVYAVGAGNLKLEDDLVITESGHELITHAQVGLELPL